MCVCTTLVLGHFWGEVHAVTLFEVFGLIAWCQGLKSPYLTLWMLGAGVLNLARPRSGGTHLGSMPMTPAGLQNH